jgi:DNA polymerase-3 subunit delta'
MAWQTILGHDAIVEKFRHSLTTGRMGSTFLFVGPAGIGKRTFALKLAQSLLCQRAGDETLDPCGHCPACVQVSSQSHPDLEMIRKPDDKSFIPIELLIGDKQHRMREGLCARIAMKPMEGGRRIAIIDDADHLNQEGANCLLKTLEEPPPRSILILIGTSPQRQLPTIRSRCQIIRFQPLQPEFTKQLILQTGLAETDPQAAQLAVMCEGSLVKARELSDPAYAEFRSQLYERLATTDWLASELAKFAGEFVDEAGKEHSAKRTRLRLVIEMTTAFYRQLLHALLGSSSSDDDELTRNVNRLLPLWSQDIEAAMACVDRCLVARQDVDRNVNQATNIEAWLDDVCQSGRHGASAISPSVVAT